MTLTIDGLFIYPVKSCGGIALSEARVVRRGLEHDRRWMVVDEEGRFTTQRTHPRLVLVRAAIEGESLRLSAPDLADLELPLSSPAGPRMEVEVWGDRIQAIQHDAGSRWFSELLSGAHALVHMPEDTERPVDPERAAPDQVVSFADGFPFLLTHVASLEHLNERVGATLAMARFRPNIVVRGGEPFVEDAWSRIRIGGVTFRSEKPCARCAITTVDPATAKRGKEPLRTLATFRRGDEGVLFGINLTHEGSGIIRVGDEVRVESRGDPSG